jgi:CubicO group peptidase (beta-lactamase class C family)
MSYPELLREEITGPLQLKETQIELSAEQKSRFLPGHDADLHPAHAWDLAALAGAGGIRSTAGDMLTYLEAYLRPDKVKPETGFGGSATLSQAIKDALPLRNGIGPRMSIALAWQFDIDSGVYWHNGETGGYSAYAFFSPLTDTAGVVLINAAIASNFTDKLGLHIRARLSGDRAISLGK